MPNSKYPLPPIVFFESHADRATSNFLIKQLPKLKKAGYTTICVDGMEPGTSLETNILMMDIGIRLQLKMISGLSPGSPDFVSANEKLRAVFAKWELFTAVKAHGFELGGIDLPVSEQLKQQELASINRESTLCKHTMNAAIAAEGGIVVVLGLGHCVFQQMINAEDENARQYLWFHLHNPTYVTQGYKDLVNAYSKKGLGTYFPLGIIVFNDSDTTLDTCFWDKISANCYKYEREKLLTGAALLLKALLGPKVSARLRTDGQHRVDALIPLAKAAEGRSGEAVDFLERLNQALQGRVRYEVTNIRTKDKVIIRDINDPEVGAQISKLPLTLHS